MYMNMYTNMNMYRYVSEAWPTNLSSPMCRKIFLYLVRLTYFLISFSSQSFFSPLTKCTSLSLYIYTYSLGFQSTSLAQLPSQGYVQCAFHHVPEGFCLKLTLAPNRVSKAPLIAAQPVSLFFWAQVLGTLILPTVHHLHTKSSGYNFTGF